jgi:Zn-finger nucleic acid-binding protein
MNCPVCHSVELSAEVVEDGLVMQTCPQCRGRFLTSSVYFDWLEVHGENLPEIPAVAVQVPASGETNHAKRCPDCGAILVPYKAGRDTGFSLDRCFHCGGVWFDENEWEILRARNLHDDVHLIFTRPWQDDVQQQEAARLREVRLRATFGSGDYDELMRIKEWLDNHPKSRELYSFLMHEARVLPRP